LHSVGQPIFLTWRLHSSLPPGRVFPAATSHGRAFVAMDRLLDTVCTGPLHLRGPEVGMVVEALRYHEETLQHYSTVRRDAQPRASFDHTAGASLQTDTVSQAFHRSR